MRGLTLALCLAIVLFATATTANAHDSEVTGDLKFTYGWQDEPTYAGLPNAVEVAVEDADGDPVDDPGAQLTVAVSFGDASITLPLVPADDVGTFVAQVVPSVPGTYRIQIMGTIASTAISITSTCSDATFDCVGDASQIRFPVADATGGTGEAAPTIRVQEHSSTNLNLMTIAAFVLGLLAVLGVGLMWVGAVRPRSST